MDILVDPLEVPDIIVKGRPWRKKEGRRGKTNHQSWNWAATLFHHSVKLQNNYSTSLVILK